MSQLVLMGGPPGVGKTTVLDQLPGVCGPCACLDADDVWRIHPAKPSLLSKEPHASSRATSVAPSGESMSSWADFERDAPELADAGRRLLIGSDGVAIAFLASCSSAGRPHLSPVCPIFCGEHLYLSASARTPKAEDLRSSGAFALHAFLGASDEEFQLSGDAAEVRAPTERAAVHDAIPFAAFDRDDPIFRLGIQRALWVYWERVGQPDTKAIRKRWSVTEKQ